MLQPDSAIRLAIEEPRLARLFDYWHAKRGERAMPARADVDPLELGFVLGHLLLVEILSEPMRFRIRLHGSELVRRAGYELTGKMLDELPINEFRQIAHQSFSTVANSGRPFHSCRNRIIDGLPHRYETLMLPLAKDGATPDMLLVGLIYKSASPG